MQGVSREGTRTFEVTFNDHLLRELDALIPRGTRSKTLERWARAFVLRQRYGQELPEDIKAVLQLID